MKKQEVEIRKVANGYVVRPPYNPAMGHSAQLDFQDVYAFETFESMVKFLKQEFEEAKE